MPSDDYESDASGAPCGPPSGARNVKYSNINSSLQWRPVESSQMGDFTETGLGMIEEIPAGSYEIVRSPDGSVIIRMKSNTKELDVDELDTNANVDKNNTKKRKREEKVAKKETKKIKKQQSSESNANGLGSDDECSSESGMKAKKESRQDTPSTKKTKKSKGGAKNKDRDALGPVSNEDTVIAMEKMDEEWGFLSLNPKILQNLANLGYGAPTAIQSSTILPAVTHYKDVIGAAATGSGKTAAYCIPIIHRLLERRERLGMGCIPKSQLPEGDTTVLKQWEDLPALILTPTRELAMQVSAHLKAFTKNTTIRTVTVVGGFSTEKQERLLQSHPDVVVATPGRLWDLISSKKYRCLQNLSNLQFLVMDEADRLVEKGHFRSLNNIIFELRKQLEEKEEKEVLDPEAEKILSEKKRQWEERMNKQDKSKPVLRDVIFEELACDLTENEDEDEDGTDSGVDTVEEEDFESDNFSDEGDDNEEMDIGEKDEESVFTMMEQASQRSKTECTPSSSSTSNKLVATPMHYKRQTFLFSATLGVATRQSIQDAAKALVEAQAIMDGHVSKDQSDKQRVSLSKKAYRKALEKASKYTPVESLMARVGLQGKPVIIKADHEINTARTAALLSTVNSNEDDIEKEVDEEDGLHENAQKNSIRSDLEDAAKIALPKGLKLARIAVTEESKDVMLYSFLLHYPGRTLIFVNAIATLKRLSFLLSALQLPVYSLHAQMQQRQRIKHLERFRTSANGILVATDVAARGLDIPSVDYVVHHSAPRTPETFVHRSGRTARGQSKGLSLSLIGPKDAKAYALITRILDMPSGLPEFPIMDNAASQRRLVQRVSLARRIAQEQTELDRDTAKQSWAVTTAAAAGLQLDEQIIEELGGVQEALASIRKKKPETSQAESDEEGQVEGPSKSKRKGDTKADQKKKSSLSLYDYDEEDDVDYTLRNVTDRISEDDKADSFASMKHRRKNITSMRRELDSLLQESLLPQGTSQKFITTNPLLNQAPHPLQSLITIGSPTIPSTSDDDEVTKSLNNNKVNTSLPSVERSGLALVAPRVILPGSVQSVSEGYNRQGGLSVGNSAAMGGKSKLKSAIQTLALRGKHAHLPGSKIASVLRKARKQSKALRR